MAKNIEVTLTLDTKNFDRNLGGAQRQLSNFSKTSGGRGGGAGIFGLSRGFIGAAAAIGGVYKAFQGLNAAIGTSQAFQDTQVVLNQLIGSAEGGAIAMARMREVAKELPYDFEQIAGAAPALTTVSESVNDLEDNMRLAADIAAVTGLSYEDAASQLQRSFSAGAGAADMFREKGVLSMAGFQAGVSYSIEETRTKLKEFGETIQGAANDLNNTLTGALSQTSDRFTTFKDSIGSAILPEFQAFLTELVGIFDENSEAITAFGTSIGNGVKQGFFIMLRAGAMVVDYLHLLYDTFAAVTGFIRDKFGGIIYNVMDVAVKAIGGVVEAVGFLGKQIGRLVEWATGYTGLKDFFENVQNAANAARTDGIEGLGEAFEGLSTAIPNRPASEFVENLISRLTEAANISREKAAEIAESVAGTLGDVPIKIAESVELTVDKFAEQFGAMADGVLNTMKVFESATKQLSADMATALLEGKSVGDALKSYFKKLITSIITEALRLAVIQPILSAIFGVSFGTGGSITGITKGKGLLGNLPGVPGRANGGPVMPGGTYLVGEKGPEYLQMGNQGGNIVPNHMLGNGQTVQYFINAVDAPSFQQLVARDPEFIYAVTRAGARRIPGRT